MNGSAALLARAVLGGFAGLGVLLVGAGLTGHRVLPRRRRAARTDRAVLRLGLAIGAFVVVGLASRWPVAGAFAAAAAAWMPTAVASSGRVHTEIARVEAIATWTEQLRDTLAAASGLESALAATVPLAPAAIAGPVERLGARLEFERTVDALRAFAVDLDHPVADFVVSSLVVATEHQARDLTGLLGQLASTARDEARMRSRVWVGRARTRTAVRVIAAVVPLMVVAVMLLDREYLAPYDSPGGQVALAMVGLVFLASFMAMERMGRIELPERFVARRRAR